MKTLNDYTFKGWNCATDELLELTVQARELDEAYRKAHKICYSIFGLRYELSLIKASEWLQWEVWLCDVDHEPGVDWPLQVAAHSQDEAEAAAELEASERRLEYGFIAGIRPVRDIAEEMDDLPF